MDLTAYLTAQLEREAKLTRKTLERVPEGSNDFKPHERSMPLGYLASLVARMPGWIALIVDRDEFDLAQAKAEGFSPPVAATRAELLDSLDNSVAEARRSLRSATEEHLLQPWAFTNSAQVVEKGPRHIMITDSVFSHLAHHRGQLTVYLRLKDSKVPALYGPSADEQH